MININTGYDIQTGVPIDSRMILSKAEMKAVSDGIMNGTIKNYPDNFFCICKDDATTYAFNKTYKDTAIGRYLITPKAGIKKLKYGFRIDPTNSTTPVTYLSDCDNADYTPVSMNLNTGEFSYGSWKEDEFFMPRPCMLKYDGTVDYYLDPNDYGKKEDGTPSDIANMDYEGNAMMEWGRDDTVIWMKIEPDTTSGLSSKANIYFTNQYEDGFHAWSFHGTDWNKDEKTYRPHFYTAIYNGSKDDSGKLRSISGQKPESVAATTPSTEYNDFYLKQALKNNPESGTGYWCIETFVDRAMITLLLNMIAKSASITDVFGRGHRTSPLLNTGTNDLHGLFYAKSSSSANVKVFGMENFWGNMWRQVAGLVALYDVSSPSGTNEIRWKTYPPYAKSDMVINLDGTEYVKNITTTSWNAMCIDFSKGIPLPIYKVSQFGSQTKDVYRTQICVNYETTVKDPTYTCAQFGASYSYGADYASPWFTFFESPIWMSPDYGASLSYR